MKLWEKTLSVGLSLAMCASLVAPALAVTYDIANGNVYVQNDAELGVYSYQGSGEKTYTSEDSEIIVTGTTTENTIAVGENVKDTTITLDNVNIDVRDETVRRGKAAMSIGANSDVTVELDGDNTLKSGGNRAGLELNNEDSKGNRVNGAKGGSVTIKDDDKDGSLTAAASTDGAGIGSGNGGVDGWETGDITITGGTVNAIGGGSCAGIGGGVTGNVGKITISGGDVTAQGSTYSAGIGSGRDSKTDTITISGGTVTAKGGYCGAGIGYGTTYGGSWKASDITITGGTVTAIGGSQAAGIGSGSLLGNPEVAGKITISGGTVTAISKDCGAGIGIGRSGTVKEITISDEAVLLAMNYGKQLPVMENNGDEDVLNGTFDKNYYSSISKSKNTVFYPVDKDGNRIKDADGNDVSFNITYQYFGISLPGEACGIKDADGNYVGYGDNMVHYQFAGDTHLLSQTGLKALKCDVDYKFRDADGKELPEEIMELLTEDVNTESEFDTIPGEGGVWSFRGWSSNDLIVGGQLQNLVHVGTWAFVPDPPVPTPVPDSTVEINDEDIPLSGLFTRADAIGYLWEQSGSPEWELSDFPDVPEDHYWAVAIGWAQAMGIALPDEDGNFRPDDPVLRYVEDLEIDPEGELQEFLNRYAVYAGIELDADELFIELGGVADDIVMGEEAQVIFDDFFAKLEAALAQAA